MSRSAWKGDTRDVVLLHGWGTNAAVWRDLSRRLAARFRMHAPLLPFSAGTPEEGASVEEIADRLARWAPRRCMVCGWSFGGAVALAWALRAPEQIARFALISTSPCFVQRAGWRHGLEPRAVQDFANGLARESSAVLARYIALQSRGDARAVRVARHLRQTLTLDGRPETPALARGLTLLRETDQRRAIASIRQPILAVHGARDAIVPIAAAEFLAGALANARLAVIEAAAHVPFVSELEGVSDQLAEFFDE
jgi:pimeloyl-[acyl-carrier protein] methyl ester esterase